MPPADGSETNQVTATILRTTDRLAVQIESDYLALLSGVSFELGQAEGFKFPIAESTTEHIKAIQSHSGGGLETFILNKRSGLAIWTKLQPSFGVISRDVPHSQTIYLACA